MKKRLQYSFLSLCAVVFMLSATSVTYAQSTETITQYHTALHLNADGTLQVAERITYDFGSNEHHGIYRDIPTTMPDTATQWWQERYATIGNVHVTMDGRSEPFTTSQSNTTFHIQIGDPNQTISGVHQYEIDYVVRGAVVKFTDGSEGLYWNAVSPSGWQVAIAHASSTLTAGAGILTGSPVCYTGPAGSTAACTQSTLPGGGFQFDATPGGGITIQARVQAGAVVYRPLVRPKVDPLQVLFALLATVLGVASLVWLVRFKRRNRIAGPIIAQYEPYPDPDTKQPIEPMYAGLIVDQHLDQRDITAAILYLATNGYITIKRTEKKIAWVVPVDDHELTLVRPLSPDAEPILKKTMELLTFDNHPGEMISLYSLQHDRRQQRANYQVRMDIISLGVTYLREHGYTEALHKVLRRTRELVWGTIGVMLAAAVLIVYGFYVAVVILVASGIVFVLIAATDRLTPKGYEAKNYLEGFKLFLSVTDKDRFAFHDDPAKNPQTFMQYLPYAVAFGVEHKWAKVFEGLSIPQPEWYSSTNNAAFSAVVLTQSLDSFSSQFATASRGMSPQSSSFGGGFSGGGGGGGGGGSW